MQHGWSRSALSHMTDGRLHLRQGATLTNFERDDATLGILIAADRDHDVVRYSLRGSTQPMAVSTYATLPPEMRALLPTGAGLARVTQEVIDRQGR